MSGPHYGVELRLSDKQARLALCFSASLLLGPAELPDVSLTRLGAANIKSATICLLDLVFGGGAGLEEQTNSPSCLMQMKCINSFPVSEPVLLL